MVRAAQAAAFDGILLRHHDGSRRPARHVLGPETVMVRIGTLANVQPSGAQSPEEPLRIADAGDRGDRQTAQLGEIAQVQRVAQCDEPLADQFHAVSAGPLSAVADQ